MQKLKIPPLSLDLSRAPTVILQFCTYLDLHSAHFLSAIIVETSLILCWDRSMQTDCPTGKGGTGHWALLTGEAGRRRGALWRHSRKWRWRRRFVRRWHALCNLEPGAYWSLEPELAGAGELAPSRRPEAPPPVLSSTKI